MTTDRDDLAARFEEQRPVLRALGFRLLGSLAEADDAVQEGWLRLQRVDDDAIEHLGAWLRTVVTRICLDQLRARAARHELPLDDRDDVTDGATPDEEVALAESTGRALLVVLDRLGPEERVTFVLHDAFAVAFADIAPIVGRTPATTKKLASRARAKVAGADAPPAAELARQRRVVEAFLAAARAGDLGAVLAVLAPDVVRTADAAALPPGAAAVLRGARSVAEGTVALAGRSRLAELALLDGAVGLVVAPRGRLELAVTFTVAGERVIAYDVVAEPQRLRALSVGVVA